MQRPYFLFSILVLASLLAGCSPNAIARPEEVKALENTAPTESPDRTGSQLADTAKSEVLPHDPPASCPVTTAKGSPSFSAPAPYSPSAPWKGIFWFGSKHLWTALPVDGVWSGLPNNPGGYTQKIMWWSDLYSLKDEPEPELVMTGERLDAKAPLVKVSKATNAFAEDIGDAMLGGADFPTLGCWKITGQYKKTSLSFVVWLAP